MTVFARGLAAAIAAAVFALGGPSSWAAECGEHERGAPLPRDGFVAAVQRNAGAVVQVVTLRTGRDPMDLQAYEFFQLEGAPVRIWFRSRFKLRSDEDLLSYLHWGNIPEDVREEWIEDRLTPSCSNTCSSARSDPGRSSGRCTLSERPVARSASR